MKGKVLIALQKGPKFRNEINLREEKENKQKSAGPESFPISLLEMEPVSLTAFPVWILAETEILAPV